MIDLLPTIFTVILLLGLFGVSMWDIYEEKYQLKSGKRKHDDNA